MQASSPGNYASIAAAIVVAGVLISASLFFAVGQATKTVTATSTESITVSVTVTSTYFASPTTSVDTTLLAECAHARTPSFGFGSVATTTSSPSIICVQLYYFNSTTPLTLDLNQTLSIYDYPICNAAGACTEPSAASNFTIGTSQNELVIGGPSNGNEGALVAYSLTARPGVDGTYELGLVGPDPYMLEPQEPVQCGYYGQVFAGAGQPDRSVAAMCITYDTVGTTTTSGGPTIPGIQYPILSGHLYFRVVGATNSTQ